jgi:hypothetical protein
MLERLQRLAAMTREQLGLFAGQVDPRTVRRLFNFDRCLDAERGGEAVRKSTICCVLSCHVQFSRTPLRSCPSRLASRAARGRPDRADVRRTDEVIRQVLLTDRPDVGREPVQRHARR